MAYYFPAESSQFVYLWCNKKGKSIEINLPWYGDLKILILYSYKVGLATNIVL